MKDNNSILVIEDEEVIRETMQLALEEEGYIVYTASNGKEAFDILSNVTNICLVFLDLMMPEMNGREFLKEKEKKAEISDIPVIVTSAFADDSKGPGVREILPKPIDLNDLLDTVKKWCDGEKCLNSDR